MEKFTFHCLPSQKNIDQFLKIRKQIRQLKNMQKNQPHLLQKNQRSQILMLKNNLQKLKNFLKTFKKLRQPITFH